MIKLKTFYFYLYFCFYSIFKKDDEYKHLGASSYLNILIASVTFSTYFWLHVWLDIKFYYPLVENLIVFLICLFLGLQNRRYFINKGNGASALLIHQDKNKITARILGILLLIGQLGLFIYSGVMTSMYLLGK